MLTQQLATGDVRDTDRFGKETSLRTFACARRTQ
jgi:hypothetical protein